MGFFAAIGAAFKAITATAIGGFLVNVAISAGLSLLAQRLSRRRVDQRPGGTQIPPQSVGEDVSQTFLLGHRATEGHLVYRNSHGRSGGQPNAFLVEVIELSDIPWVSLSGLIINDRVATIGETEEEYGFPLTNIALDDGTVCAWVKFYDGTQTSADPYLVSKFGNDTGYAWTANHIATGLAYAVVTYRYDRRVFQNQPRARFVLAGIPLYDPRKDSTVGGEGPQRWGQPETYAPSANSAVQVYNILRGVTLPTGEVYGAGVAAADIPLANAVAGMNVCDTLIDGRAQFETSVEIRVAEDEPADKIEEILAGALGQISEQGGIWRTRFGAPASPVLTFTDGDISISDAQSFDPIKGLESTHNAIVTTYLEPADLWEPRATDLLRNAGWEAEDGQRLLPVELQLGAVSNRNQARQVQAALITDHRRQRQHALVLPPDAMGLDVLDDVRWTSARNGYVNKDFEVAQTIWRTRSGMMQVVLRERDPDDYDWQPSQDLPLPPDMLPQLPPAALAVPGWAVAGVAVLDQDGIARRPAVRLSWSDQDYRSGQLLRWQLRLAATGVLVVEGVTPAQDLQHTIADALLAGTGYQARARIIAEERETPWTDWLGAVTPDVRLTQADMADSLREEFDAARDLIDGTVEDIGGVIGDLRDRIGQILAPVVGPNLPGVPHIARIDADLIAEAQARASELAAEAQARVDALTAEAEVRAAAITAEAQARSAAIAQVADAISDEVAARTAAVQALSDDIATETAERVSDALALAGDIRDTRDRIQRTANELLDLAALEHLEREEIRTSLTVQVEGARADYTQQITLLAGEQTAIAQQVVTLDAATAALGASITAIDAARIEGDDALAAQIALLSVGSAVQFDQVAIWYWDDTVEGWTGDPDAPTVTADGWLVPAPGSFIISPAGLEVTAQTFRQVRARLRNEPGAWADAWLYWAAQGEAWDASRRIAIAEPDWADDEAQLTMNPDWSGVIDRVRLDLPDGVEIDWLAIGRPAPGASSADIAAERQARIAQGLALASEISALTADLTDAEGLITGNADAIDAITVRVEEAETGLITVSEAQTVISGQIEDLETGLTATGEAVDLLTVRAEALEDGQSLQSESVRAVRAALKLVGNEALEGVAASLLRDQEALDVIATASQVLNSRIDASDDQIAIVAEAVTLLQAAIPGLANAQAVQALTTRVDVTEDQITAISNSLLTLTSDVAGIAADLSQNYYTSAETDGEISAAVAGVSSTLGAQIGDVAADLAANYYTRVETDGEISGAVSAVETSLGSQIGTVVADLANNYYTQVETDGQISSATSSVQTALESQIGQVDDDLASLGAALATNYYTSTQTDGEISSAVSALDTQLRAEITGVGNDLTSLSAELSQNYYTRTETDGEISAAVSSAVTTLQSKIGAVAADLSTNYYTQTETDGEIASAVSGAVTQIESRLNDPETGLQASADGIDGLTGSVEQLETGSLVQSESIRAVKATQRLQGSRALDGLAATLLRDQKALEVIADASQVLNTRIDATDDQIAIVAEAVTLLQAAIPGLATTQALQMLATQVEVAEDQITALSQAVTSLQATIPDLATASALQSLETRVTSAEGASSTQALQITDLQTGLDDAESGIDANAGAISSLSATVTQQGDQIQAVSGDLTNLTNRVTTAEGDIDAQSGALQSLTSRVTVNEGAIDSQAQAITDLESGLSNAQSGVTANSSALAGLTTRTTDAEDAITAQAQQITDLQAGLDDAESGIDANGGAISSLTATVTQQGTTISAINDSVTQLQSDLSDAQSNVAANATALSGLSTRVTSVEGNVLTLSGDLTTLENSLNALGGTVSANSGAISSLQSSVTQQGTTITAQGQSISDLQAGLSNAQTGISGNASAINTTVARVEDVEGEIESIAASQRVLEASNRAGNLIPNGSFATGDFTGWANVPAEFSIVQKGSSAASAVQSAPSRYILRVPSFTAGASAVSVGQIPFAPGDRLRVSFATAGGGSNPNATFRVSLQGRNASGVLVQTLTISRATGTVSWTEHTEEIPPGSFGPDVVTLLVRVNRQFDQSGDGYFANLRVERDSAAAVASNARIDTLETVKVDAAGAVAAVDQQISASYANLTALAEATAFAEATVDGITEGFVWSLGGDDVLSLIRVDDGSAPSTNARIKSDYILLDGNVSIAGDFEVRGQNIVLDGDTTVTGAFTVGQANIENGAIGSAQIAGTLQSDNFVQGSAGWRIQKTGEAEFGTLALRQNAITRAHLDHFIFEQALPTGSFVTISTITFTPEVDALLEVHFRGALAANFRPLPVRIRINDVTVYQTSFPGWALRDDVPNTFYYVERNIHLFRQVPGGAPVTITLESNAPVGQDHEAYGDFTVIEFKR